MVPAENKAKCFSSLNNTTKTIHHHHQTRLNSVARYLEHPVNKLVMLVENDES